MPSLAGSADAKPFFSRWLKLALLSFMFCFSNSKVCSAYTITIVENSQADFGTLLKPAAGTQTFTINPQTGATSGTGTLLSVTTSVADYTVKCTAGCVAGSTATVKLTAGTNGDPALSWPSLTGSWDGGATFTLPKSGLALGSNVSHDFKFAGGASYTSSIPAAVIHPTYTITFSTP